ncbi:MAG TPA: type II toxin-antitoxin system VapC family toxin [Nitrospirota bacterium]|nr:type II toxin-antitoxin system VapC family toxin [Nitrospirota bacterium]
MMLVDTSVWVEHFRTGTIGLESSLNEGQVICHPFIVGELACGNLRNRLQILSLLVTLPSAQLADHEEVMLFIETHRLMGKGLGYVDIHLLASAIMTGVPVWTFDKKLNKAAATLGIKF